MNRVWRIAVIGYAHSHIMHHVKCFLKLGSRIDWVATADLTPLTQPRTDVDGTRYGIMNKILGMVPFRKRYDNYEQLLEENQLDLVITCSENARHAEVASAALKRGIHVLMEKPFASSLQEALKIVRAAEEGNAEIIINWPTTWTPAIRHAHYLISQGEIGKLFKITYRNSDSYGPLSYGQEMTDFDRSYEWWYQQKAGGGALLDYCCYGACLSRWFFGEKAVGAYGLKGRFDSFYGDVEDYATITARYPKGVAILEGSWTTQNTGVACGPLFFGTEGTMVVEKPNTLSCYRTRHQHKPDIEYDIPPLPAGREDIAQEVISHLETGTPLHPTLSLPVNLDAMALLDAGIRSAESNKMEFVNDKYWCIG